jgi:hypothetical protein
VVISTEKKVLYPETRKVLREAILAKYPEVKANEFRAEWRDDFEKFRKDPERVASRLLWMLDHMETNEFLCPNNFAYFGRWIGQICGQVEALGWINPGRFIGALHTDDSQGNDQ